MDSVSGFYPPETRDTMRESEGPFLEWVAKRSTKAYSTHGFVALVENPQGSCIGDKSPFSSLVAHPDAKRKVTDQCQHGAMELTQLLPARRATLIVYLGITLSKRIFLRCVGDFQCSQHADLLNGKAGPLAVYPWKFTGGLTKEFQIHLNGTAVESLVMESVSTVAANVSSVQILWSCERCNKGASTDKPHTRTKGCRYCPKYPSGGIPPAPSVTPAPKPAEAAAAPSTTADTSPPPRPDLPKRRLD